MKLVNELVVSADGYSANFVNKWSKCFVFVEFYPLHNYTRLLGIFFGIYVMSRMTPHATVVIMLFVCTYNENQFQISAGAAIALCMSLYSISEKARSHTASCAPRTALKPSRTRKKKTEFTPREQP